MGALPLQWLQPRLLRCCCAAILVTFAARPAVLAFDLRVTPPALIALEARRALVRAREAGALECAGGALGEAVCELSAARAERDFQASRRWPLRDFRAARARYEAALAAARLAERMAGESQALWTGRVETRLEVVGGMADQVVELTRDMRLERDERRSLRVARLKLTEARLHVESGHHEVADGLVREALALTSRSVGLIESRAARYIEGPRVQRWRSWEAATIAWSRRHRAAAIVVNKERNRLTLYVDGRPQRTFGADIGQRHFDSKLRDGDRATPEGRYRVATKKDRGASMYYRALLLDYPNDEDRRRHAEAVRDGRVSREVGAGNLIEIHGRGGRGRDWTEGCVALSDPDIDYVFDAVRVGTPVTIIGGDGRGGRFSSLTSDLTVVRDWVDAFPAN